MQDDLEGTIRSIWRQLQSRYGWSLVETADLGGFLEGVAATLNQRPAGQIDRRLRIKAVIQQRYYRRTYDAIIKGRLNPHDPAIAGVAQQACGEVYAMVWRLMVSRRYDPHLAEEVAQKVVERLLDRPDKVRSPEALMIWAVWQMRDFLKRENKTAPDSLDQARAGEDAEDGKELIRTIASTEDISSHAEAAILIQEIFDLLPSILSEFQQQVIDLVVVQGYLPHELTERLQTTAHRIRVEKSRALAIIRSHPRIAQWLESE